MLYDTPLVLTVRESEGLITYTREDLIRYAGHGHVIASGLIMRLFDRAFRDLSPEKPPMRRELHVLSAFPGLGVRDGIELVTHAVTDGRFKLDLDAGGSDAPPSPIGGRMYFEVSYQGRTFAYTLRPDLFNDEWREKVAAYQKGATDVEMHARYVAYKYGFLGRLLTASDPFLIAREKVPA